MKKAWSWAIAVVLLSIYVTGDIVWLLSDLSNAGLLAPGIVMLVPLALIILDRKNYLNMIRQRNKAELTKS
jgi:Na+/alanine symporter